MDRENSENEVSGPAPPVVPQTQAYPAEWFALLDSAHGILLLAGPDRRIRWMNRAPLDFGLSRFVGRDFIDFAAPSQRALVEAATARVLEGAAATELEVQGVESARWYRVRLSAVREQGRHTGFAVHALDVDDAKRGEIERAMLRARIQDPVSVASADDDAHVMVRRLHLMADALPVLIAYVDSERRYQYNNAAYERWFETSREALRGRHLESVLGSGAYERIRGYVDAALLGQSTTFEMPLPYRDAGLRRVVAHYVPDIASTGAVRGFYALIDDVTTRRAAETELRQREDELRQLQKMEALGRLAGGIAHDFNNLLHTVIIGCSAVLQMVSDEASPVARQIGRIRRAALRGRSLTRQLLSFSRRSAINVGLLDLDDLLGDLEILLDHLLDSRVILEADLNADCQVIADAGQIQQVIMNLVINARDAMPEGGHLRLSTRRVVVSAEDAQRRPGWTGGSYGLVTVEDTGTGMDEKTLARMFDPFFTTKSAGDGTGLGLSTAYSIVTRLGGHIEADSTPGAGTVFRLYLPCQ